MHELRYTLVADGSSDAALLPILTWLLIENGMQIAIQGHWADLRRLPQSGKNLQEKIQLAVEFYPCDLLFIHRDAEIQPRETRLQEIAQAIATLKASDRSLPHICVVPVRMTEAWLLSDEKAIRHAAGNRPGRMSLELPALAKLEALPDPKQTLYEALKVASGLQGRRLKQFPVHFYATRVTELIYDFSPLRRLSAFAALETDVKNLVQQFIRK